jgi:hypothetical protein
MRLTPKQQKVTKIYLLISKDKNRSIDLRLLMPLDG